MRHVKCDGIDCPRHQEECLDELVAVVVLSGQFSYADSRGRATVHPSSLLFLRPQEGFCIRHPREEGDICMSFRGGVVRALEDRLEGCAEGVLPPTDYAALSRLVSGLHKPGWRDPLEVEESVALVLGNLSAPERSGRRRARELASTIEEEVGVRFDEAVPLTRVARKCGVSIFHACRVFRTVTGRTIHATRRELRLRHALSLLLDTREPLAQVALLCGFANQGHLSNQFRLRFGVTPGEARRRGRVAH